MGALRQWFLIAGTYVAGGLIWFLKCFNMCCINFHYMKDRTKYKKKKIGKKGVKRVRKQDGKRKHIHTAPNLPVKPAISYISSHFT